MRSSKAVRIELRHPQLKALRKNLRIVLKLSILDASDKLLKEEKRYEASETFNLLSGSLLQCGAGAVCRSYEQRVKEEGFDPQDRPIDLDMVWAPYFRSWFCVKCYDEFFQYHDHEEGKQDDWDPLWDDDDLL